MTSRYFSQKQKQALYVFAGGLCEICGTPLPEDWHADHVIPYSVGGETDVINGQATCPHCNLRKGNKVKVTSLPKDFKERSWQIRAIDQFFSKLPSVFSVMATPGAGKTPFALLVARRLFEQGLIDFIVVIAPYENLKEQWVYDASEFGIEFDTEFKIEVPGRGLVISDDFHGIVTSYQQIAYGGNSDVFRKTCSHKRVLAILDEPHHCGNGNTWGDAVHNALALATHTLSITGTPYRTDQKEIPFLPYTKYRDEDGVTCWKPVMDFTYSYGEALADKEVVRRVEFPKFDGEMTWIEKAASQTEQGLFEWANDPTVKTKTFADPVTQNEARIRLNTALLSEGGWIKAVLEAANNQLEEVRRNEQPDAGGLVVVKGIKEAKQIAEKMKDLFGEFPTIVTYEEAKPLDIINGFAKSNNKWIVAVRMISEGINIKRLRVGIYATNIMTRMFFEQVLGRIVRWQKNIDGAQIAYLFIPRTEPYLTYAKEITEIVDHIIIQEFTEESEKENGGNNGKDSKWIEYVSSNGWETDRELDGEIFSAEEVEKARQAIIEEGLEGRITATELAKLWRKSPDYASASSSATRPPIVTPPPQKKPKRDYKKQLRKECQGLSSALIAFARKICGLELDYKEIHGAWAKLPQGDHHSSSTIETLEAKKDWLQRKIITAQNGVLTKRNLWHP